MDANFALRRELYGDACLGVDNLRMKEIATQHGCPAKFPGSGGAIVGMCLDCDAKLVPLQHALEEEGFVFCRLQPNPPPS
jgi:glucuronokinase